MPLIIVYSCDFENRRVNRFPNPESGIKAHILAILSTEHSKGGRSQLNWSKKRGFMEETERVLSEVTSWDVGMDTDQEAKESWNREDGLVVVTRINLKHEYMKIQRKRVEGSQQRIEDGVVYFAVFSPMQILNVRTFVQRFADLVEEINLNKAERGWSELYTKTQTQKGATYDYMADLDSVYKNQEGSYVYSLVKNKGNSVKNIYYFFVRVELLDQTVEGFCWPFLLKTKPVKKLGAHSMYPDE